MSFKKYEAYKDSGVEWLGEIPSHWLCISLKNIEPYNSQMVQTGPFGAQLHASDYVDEGVPLILIKNVRNLAIDDSDIPKISAEDAKRLSIYRVEVGDIVFSRVGSIGRIAKVTEKERGWLISGQMLRLRLGSNSLNPAYSVYALSSKIVEDYVTYYSVGSTRDSINTEILMNLKIPLPPLEEQKRIAAFLDKETTKIDTLIDKQEQLIALLQEKRQAIISHAVTRGLNPNAKMKDSGIEWLEEVPEHWEVKKLKFVARIQPSNVDKKSKENEKEVLLCNYTDVYYNEEITADLSLMKATASDVQIRKFTLKRGDTIITKDSEDPNDIAVPAYVPQDLEGVVCGYHLALLRPGKGTCGGYLKRVMDTQYARSVFATRANGITRYGLGTYAISNFILPLPPLEEQKQIAAFLDKETTKIDTLIEKCETAIELLKERRPALIAAAVTGKIDVRDVG